MIFKIDGRDHFLEFSYGTQKHPVKARQIMAVGSSVRHLPGRVPLVLVAGGVINDLELTVHMPLRYTRCQVWQGEPGRGFRTRCKLVADARTFCLPQDRFEKEQGRHHALTAVLANKTLFPDAVRTMIWAAYHDRNAITIDMSDDAHAPALESRVPDIRTVDREEQPVEAGTQTMGSTGT